MQHQASTRIPCARTLCLICRTAHAEPGIKKNTQPCPLPAPLWHGHRARNAMCDVGGTTPPEHQSQNGSLRSNRNSPSSSSSSASFLRIFLTVLPTQPFFTPLSFIIHPHLGFLLLLLPSPGGRGALELATGSSWRSRGHRPQAPPWRWESPPCPPPSSTVLGLLWSAAAAARRPLPLFVLLRPLLLWGSSSEAAPPGAGSARRAGSARHTCATWTSSVRPTTDGDGDDRRLIMATTMAMTMTMAMAITMMITVGA